MFRINQKLPPLVFAYNYLGYILERVRWAEQVLESDPTIAGGGMCLNRKV